MKRSLAFRFRSSVFAAEQNAIWNDKWRQGPEDPYVFLVLAWLVYWAHPGTWRRIPAAFRAFVVVVLWWPLVRVILRRPKYPADRKKRA